MPDETGALDGLLARADELLAAQDCTACYLYRRATALEDRLRDAVHFNEGRLVAVALHADLVTAVNDARFAAHSCGLHGAEPQPD